jgi:hypothetical protein
MRRPTLEDMKTLARCRSGECVSTTYLGVMTKHRWRCSEGHEWDAIPNSVQKGSWCPYCAGKRIWSPGKTEAEARLEECHSAARSHGGGCVSTTYLGAMTKHRWRCNEGHEWEAIPSKIKQGRWCPYCAGNLIWSSGLSDAEARLEECRSIACARGGECLSVAYLGTKVKHRWRCSDGHEWDAVPNSIKNGQWCPQCSGGLNEELCRIVLERLTGQPWRKAKPKWLLNDRGGLMELDGFCKPMGIAFEYHGKQHYEAIPHFHRDKNTLIRRMADDQRKRELCNEHGVKLIEIPYTVSSAAMVSFLADSLSEVIGRHFEIPDGMNLDSLGYDRGSLNGLRSLASERDGECLSATYLGVMTEHRWRCVENHEWEASPNSIKRGTWCPYCAGTFIWSPGLTEAEARLEDCRSIARAHGGECLSSTYLNSSTHLQWRCASEHEWKAIPAEIKSGKWCPFCAGQRLWSPGKSHAEAGLEECRSIARTQGGECLAVSYLGNWRVPSSPGDSSLILGQAQVG